MTDERFQDEYVAVFREQLVDIIREQSVAYKLYPVNQAITASDNTYVYFKMKEQSNVQYGYELRTPLYNKYASERVTTAIPVHQADLFFDRHEKGRAMKDVFTLDARTRQAIEDMVEDIERTAIYGDSNTGTVLSDTTNISTAASPELDLGTFKEAVEDFHGQVSQLRNLLKNKFQGTKLNLLWTTDVDDRARGIASTTSEEITFYDYVAKWLSDFNGGGIGSDHIFASNYLGSNTNAGTTNTALIASDPRNMELITSELEVVQGLTPLEDLEIQVAIRNKPIFYRSNDAVIYGATAVLTA